MTNPECAFCDTESLQDRAIYIGSKVMSIVSNPWWRPFHCQVIPVRHIKHGDSLNPDEAQEMMHEMLAMESAVNLGNGSVLLRNGRLDMSISGVTVEHFHFDVYPVLDTDDMLVPVPTPEDFVTPSHDDIRTVQSVLRVRRGLPKATPEATNEYLYDI